jgi:hypothetical protein
MFGIEYNTTRSTGPTSDEDEDEDEERIGVEGELQSGAGTYVSVLVQAKT